LNAPLDIKSYMLEVGRRARAASREVARADTATKNRALIAAAKAVRRDAKKLLAANAEDVKSAKAAGKDAAFIDRLALTEKTIEGMAEGLEQVAKLPDPVGSISELKEQPSGIKVGRMRVPLGVIGIVYESRPNVTADAAALCLKAGNACILRGGSEAIRSNQAIGECVHEGLRATGLPEDAVQVVETADRAAVGQLLSMSEYVDIIVPRGGKDLIERGMRECGTPRSRPPTGYATATSTSAPTSKRRSSSRTTRRRSATACATPWKPCSSTSRSHRKCCPGSRRI